MKKYLSFTILLLAVLILPNFANAQSITGIVANLANVIRIVSGFVAISFWIITGLLFLTASGDPSKLGKARVALIGAIIGTAIGILALAAPTIIETAITAGQ